MIHDKTPLVITNESISKDPALQSGARGARKIAVTSLYHDSEHPYSKPYWYGSDESTPVMVMQAAEMAVFTHETSQDKHFHKLSHEFYTILSGEFHIDVEGEVYTLQQGETIVVPPYAIHEVLRETTFTAQVIAIDSRGLEDKYISE